MPSTAVGSADSLYEAYASSDEGVVYLPTGEVVLPGYRYNSDLGFGLLCVADEDYNYGVVDLEGNIVQGCPSEIVLPSKDGI